jgi:hypothetical protein
MSEGSTAQSSEPLGERRTSSGTGARMQGLFILRALYAPELFN